MAGIAQLSSNITAYAGRRCWFFIGIAAGACLVFGLGLLHSKLGSAFVVGGIIVVAAITGLMRRQTAARSRRDCSSWLCIAFGCNRCLPYTCMARLATRSDAGTPVVI
jgi:uncharacterized membrane protein YdcZ (DUF606 family)